jgi:pimeloyl-ACP methyl ester carboxylesterase
MSDAGSDRFIHANGIDIHIIEAGAGEPLILLENGMICTNPLWSGWMSSYGSHVETLAQHFRVIVPDFRGSGRTVHPGGACIAQPAGRRHGRPERRSPARPAVHLRLRRRRGGRDRHRHQEARPAHDHGAHADPGR